MITKISILSKFQNKTIRVISSLVIALAMAVSSMAFVDFNVYAEDSSTYVVVEPCITPSYNTFSFPVTSYNDTGTNPEIRALVLHSGSNYYLMMVSQSSFKYSSSMQSGCPVGSGNVSYKDYDLNYYFGSWVIYANQEWHVPVIETSDIGNATKRAKKAYAYTFGDLAVNPPEPTVYGTLKDLTFSSSVVGSGNGTGEANKDTIKWYPFSDSNNKMFGTGGSVEIRVVPGDYISQSQEGIFTQTYTDFVLDVAHAGHLATVQAYTGLYSVNWGTVMQKLSASWPALELLWDGEYWKKLGWVYQVRYQFEEDEGTDKWSDWQTVYNITSSTPSGTQGLDPADGTALPGFYENVVDAFNTTSIVNNNTNQTYYVNNIQYIVNENPDEPSDDVTNDLLREIRNITIQIRQLIVEQNNDGDERDPEDTGLNDKDEELHDKEQELIDDMNSKLNDIDTDVDLITTDGFLGAAQWVRAQYDHLTLNTPFELIIVFALVLGIGLIFIGKVR